MLECFNDVVADFRVFYRIDSIEEMGRMPTDEFFAMANRLVAYQGAVRWQYEIDLAEAEAQTEAIEQPDRLLDSGGEVSQTAVQDSYLYDLLTEEMAHG